MAASFPQRPRFSLSFRVLHDGQDTPRAQALTAAGSPFHGGRFPAFPRLPAELRLKVWEYLLAPRVVAVACLDAESDPDDPPEPWAAFPELQAPPPRPVPALLGVNRETRALALARYRPAFGWKVPHVLLAAMDDAAAAASSAVSRVSHHPSAATAAGLPSSTASHTPSASPSSLSSSSRWSPPRVWFDFDHDALYLLGELEPCDSYGFNSPMAYFLDREEALRVRRLAVAFGALRYGESGSQHIFGALFHVVDRFARLEGARVLVAVVPRDEFTHLLVGGEGTLVRPEGEGSGAGEGKNGKWGQDEEAGDMNVVQRIWRDWYRGSLVTSSLANVEFELIREADLPEYIARPVKSDKGQI